MLAEFLEGVRSVGAVKRCEIPAGAAVSQEVCLFNAMVTEKNCSTRGVSRLPRLKIVNHLVNNLQIILLEGADCLIDFAFSAEFD